MTEKNGIEPRQNQQKQDQLAKRKPESGELSTALSSLPQLDQVLTRVQVRWPFPEMGDLEYQDWKETLAKYPIPEILAALNRLMDEPPIHGDEEYRGRPSLVDVTRTIAIMRGEARTEQREKQKAAKDEEFRQLAKRREEHPEEFATWQEVCEGFRKKYPVLAGRVGLAMASAAAHEPTDEELAKRKDKMLADLERATKKAET